jgi:hypothetical protein
MPLLSVRVGSVQLAGLQCHTDAFEEPAVGEGMPATLVDGRLVFEATACEALAAYLSEASNSADAQAQEEARKVPAARDRDALAQDRAMAAALATLSSRVRRMA